MAGNNWEIYFNAVKNQDWEGAKKVLKKISFAEKDNPQVYLKLGDVYQRAGDTANAIASYHQSANIQRSQGFNQKAVALYKIIMRLDPHNEEAIKGSEEVIMEMDSAKASVHPASFPPLSEFSPAVEGTEPPVPDETTPSEVSDEALPDLEWTSEGTEGPAETWPAGPSFGETAPGEFNEEAPAGLEWPSVETESGEPVTSSFDEGETREFTEGPSGDIEWPPAESETEEPVSSSFEECAPEDFSEESPAAVEWPASEVEWPKSEAEAAEGLEWPASGAEAGLPSEETAEPPEWSELLPPSSGPTEKEMEEMVVPLSERGGISGVPELFAGMSEEEFRNVLNEFEVRSFPDKANVVEEGDSGDSLYIIKAGSARVVAHLLGKEIELAVLGEGDVFGEVAFLTGRPRTAAVVADGPLEVYEINRLNIEKIIERNPDVLSKLEDFYESRVKDTIRKIMPKQ